MKKTIKKLVAGMLGLAMALELVGCVSESGSEAQDELNKLVNNSNYILYKENSDEKYNIETYIELYDGVYKEEILQSTNEEAISGYYIVKDGEEFCYGLIKCSWDTENYKVANIIEGYKYQDNVKSVSRFTLNKSDVSDLLSSAYDIKPVEGEKKINAYTYKTTSKENTIIFEGNSIYIKEEGLSYYHQYTFETVDDSYADNIINKMKKLDSKIESKNTKELIEYLGLKL
jgi:hypothetical protein